MSEMVGVIARSRLRHARPANKQVGQLCNHVAHRTPWVNIVGFTTRPRLLHTQHYSKRMGKFVDTSCTMVSDRPSVY